MAYENKGALAATIVVAASNSLNKGAANQVCSGAADDVEIQAALNAAAGGEVILLEGNYVTTANLTVPDDTCLRGQGFGTIITPTGAAIGGAANGAIELGSRSMLKDMKVILAAGAGAANTRPNVVSAVGKIQVWIDKVWLLGDTTVADDGSAIRQNGILFAATTESKIINCRTENCKYVGIVANNASNYCTITGNTSKDNVIAGISISSNFVVIVGNICEGNTGGHGILLYPCSYCTVLGNICEDNYLDGINLTGDGTTNSDYNTLTGNVCYNNGDDGIEIAGGVDANKNIVLGNQLLGNAGTALVDGGTNTEIQSNITV